MEINKDIVLLHDTSIMSGNRGDDIIMKAVKTELGKIFPYSYFINIPTHDYPSSESKKVFQKTQLSFVGGTNLLSGNMDVYNQWKVQSEFISLEHHVILMGVGWWQYQKDINSYTADLLNSILSKHYVHSVRDEYTKEKLKSIGITNVINTGCPTLWNLNNFETMVGGASNVVFTLTDYSKNPLKDRLLIDILMKKYEKLYFWVQGSRDYSYLEDLCGAQMKRITVVPPTVQAFDSILSKGLNLDYIGTRLHAGIRAMQHGVQTLILSIDNRAEEMHRDFNLPVLKRDNIDLLEGILQSHNHSNILRIPKEHIAEWKIQFNALKS